MGNIANQITAFAIDQEYVGMIVLMLLRVQHYIKNTNERDILCVLFNYVSS